jgi:hypothetical protein
MPVSSGDVARHRRLAELVHHLSDERGVGAPTREPLPGVLQEVELAGERQRDPIRERRDLERAARRAPVGDVERVPQVALERVGDARHERDRRVAEPPEDRGETLVRAGADQDVLLRKGGRKGGGLVGEPGRGLVGGKGNSPF